MCGISILLVGGILVFVRDPNATANATSAPISGPAAPARPGDIAVQEELEAARKAGTIAAYELFVARHPDHPLAHVARAELQRLKR